MPRRVVPHHAVVRVRQRVEALEQRDLLVVLHVVLPLPRALRVRQAAPLDEEHDAARRAALARHLLRRQDALHRHEVLVKVRLQRQRVAPRRQPRLLVIQLPHRLLRRQERLGLLHAPAPLLPDERRRHPLRVHVRQAAPAHQVLQRVPVAPRRRRQRAPQAQLLAVVCKVVRLLACVRRQRRLLVQRVARPARQVGEPHAQHLLHAPRLVAVVVIQRVHGEAGGEVAALARLPPFHAAATTTATAALIVVVIVVVVVAAGVLLAILTPAALPAAALLPLAAAVRLGGLARAGGAAHGAGTATVLGRRCVVPVVLLVVIVVVVGAAPRALLLAAAPALKRALELGRRRRPPRRAARTARRLPLPPAAHLRRQRLHVGGGGHGGVLRQQPLHERLHDQNLVLHHLALLRRHVHAQRHRRVRQQRRCDAQRAQEACHIGRQGRRRRRRQ